MSKLQDNSQTLMAVGLGFVLAFIGAAIAGFQERNVTAVFCLLLGILFAVVMVED